MPAFPSLALSSRRCTPHLPRQATPHPPADLPRHRPLFEPARREPRPPRGTPIIRRRQRHAWVIATLGYQATGYVSQLEMHVAACLGGRPRHPPPCPRFSSHHRWPCCPAVLLPTCWSVWVGWCKAASGRGDGDTAALRFAAAAGAKKERQRNEHIGTGNRDRSRSTCRPSGQGGRALCPAPDADDAGGAIPG